jgi:hypothetical protein
LKGLRFTRHGIRVKPIFLLLLFVSFAWSDGLADQAAISQVIQTLNLLPPSAALFTPDGLSEFERLRIPDATVTISHEPWGEATIGRLGLRISSGAIRLITEDVALADVDARSTPLLLVMKKEAGKWKISSVRMLAAR